MHATEITQDTPVGEIATVAPLATRVFARHGIDFCCGGGVPIEEACGKRGLATDDVLDSSETDEQSVRALEILLSPAEPERLREPTRSY